MSELTEQELRNQAQGDAKNFKSSWIALGRTLHSVWKEKIFKFWGYLSFEAYTQKELGIRNKTAAKLLKSYYFLESKEPQYLSRDYHEKAEAAQVPSYESVNTLRLANGKKDLKKSDYEDLKKDVFEKGRDHREVAKELTTLIKAREEVDPVEAKERSRMMVLKRFLSNLKSAKQEMESLNLVPKKVLKEADELIHTFEDYL